MPFFMQVKLVPYHTNKYTDRSIQEDQTEYKTEYGYSQTNSDNNITTSDSHTNYNKK